MTDRASEELMVGDRIKDNDPRQPGRVLTITALGVRDAHGLQNVRAKRSGGVEVRISVHRIHVDGKPRRSGFSLVSRAVLP